MMPLSYQGFGFTAILVIGGDFSAGQLLKYLKERFQHPKGLVSPNRIIGIQSKNNAAAIPSSNNSPAPVNTSFPSCFSILPSPINSRACFSSILPFSSPKRKQTCCRSRPSRVRSEVMMYSFSRSRGRRNSDSK